MPYILNAKPSPMIFEYDDFFTEAECDTIIEIGESLNPTFGQIYNGDPGGAVKNDIRKCGVSWIRPNEDTAWIFQKLAFVSQDINKKYFNFALEWGEDAQFTKYDSKYQGFFGKHIDTIAFSGESVRKISMSVILNEDFEGGDLNLYINDNPHVVRKKKGNVVIFPSFLLHEVTPVTAGVRYSLVNWVNGARFR